MDDQFIAILDDLVEKSEDDSELADGLRWIDEQAWKKGMSFYDMALIVVRRHMAEQNAREWLQRRKQE